MKICLIRQPAGLGDIFFTQKIAKKILKNKESDKIIWPVIKEYEYLANYMFKDNITFINEQNSFPFKEIYLADPHYIINNSDLLYIPLQRAQHENCHAMLAKYKFIDLPYEDWQYYFEFERNFEREKYLEKYLEKIQGLDINKSFNLINDSFGSKNTNRDNKISIQPIKNNHKIIKMDYLDFDNVFDWIGLMDKATEIHTVDTVWCFLLKQMNKKNVTVYSRIKNASFFSYAFKLFDPEWSYVL